MPRSLNAAHLAVLAVLGVLCCSPARGELFELRDGGRIVGRLLNPDESPRVNYRIETPSGGQITLAADQVARRGALSPKEAKYEALRAKVPDTIDGHWKLAEWCRENYMSSQRKVHLNRIVQLDPNHKAARGALGYELIDGKWLTRREVMEGRGFRWYRGRYRSKEVIEAMKLTEQRRQNRNKWRGQLKRYRSWLDGKRYEQGRQAILAINDPAAVEALDQFLKKEKDAEFKSLYIEALARLNTPGAEKSLCACAVEDNDPMVRELCLDRLRKGKWPGAVHIFIGNLKSKDNVIINRAAVALSAMKDKSAIRPLIDALVTEHKYKITTGKPGGIGAGFGSGGSGLSVGSSTKVYTITKENQAVLDALASLTGGAKFGFDVSKWTHWYNQQHKRTTIDARRD